MPAVRRYVMCHGLNLVAIASVLVGVLSWWLGDTEITIPGMDQPLKVTLRRLLPAVIACLVAGSLSSPLSWMEDVAPGTRARSGLHLCLAAAIGGGIVAFSEAMATRDGDVVVVLRAYLMWSALAVLSGRLFGSPLAWVFPVVSLVPVLSLGSGGPSTAQWWGWATEPAGNVRLSVAVLVLVGGAGIAHWLSPWTLFRLLRYRRHVTGSPPRIHPR